jgi:hypothetical protein
VSAEFRVQLPTKPSSAAFVGFVGLFSRVIPMAEVLGVGRLKTHAYICVINHLHGFLSGSSLCIRAILCHFLPFSGLTKVSFGLPDPSKVREFADDVRDGKLLFVTACIFFGSRRTGSAYRFWLACTRPR